MSQGFDEIEYESEEPTVIRVVVSPRRITVNDMIEQAEGAKLSDRIRFMARFVVNADGRYVSRCVKTADGGLRFDNLDAAEKMLRNADIQTLEAAATQIAEGMRGVKDSSVPLPPGGS